MRALRFSPSLLLAFVLAAAAAGLGALAFFTASWAPAAGHSVPPALRPDLNAAPGRHLMLLPGIGPARARAIVEDRALRGPFGAVGDLARVRGIGPGTAAALAALVRAPVRPREAPTGDVP